jgi:hypothetical protein
LRELKLRMAMSICLPLNETARNLYCHHLEYGRGDTGKSVLRLCRLTVYI